MMSCVIMVISKLQHKIKIRIPHTAVEEKDTHTHTCTNADPVKGQEDAKAIYQCKCQCPSPNVAMIMRHVGWNHPYSV